MLLKGKTTVVTGASRGIGRCIVETFAQNGASVIACVRAITPELLVWAESFQHNEDNFVRPVLLDLENEESAKSLGKRIMSMNPKIDVLVNNAGVASGSLMQMTTASEMKKVFDINFFNQILVTQSISRLMQRNKSGSIINIASTAAFIGDPGTMVYGSSKAAFVRASMSMARELGASNIRVNAIAPSVTQTDMMDKMEEEAINKLITSSALKRIAEPQDVANVALFLASDLSNFITGQTIRVDGGIV